MSLKIFEGDDEEKIVKAFLAEFLKAAILGDSRIKNAALYSCIPFWHFFAVFHHKVCVFIISISFFLMKYQLFAAVY